MTRDIEDTGERFLPETISSDYERFWYFRQLFGYRYAAERLIAVTDRVLEIGSGEGYGAELLAGSCSSVTALDKSEEAVAHASAKYARPNLEYRAYHGDALPFPDECFDKVVSLHCIEHIRGDSAFVREVSRVLKKGGLFIVSTPNKEFRVQPTAWYKYHVREYTAPELETLLKDDFDSPFISYVTGPRKFFDMELRLTRMGNRIQRLDVLGLYRRVPNLFKQYFFRLFSLFNRGGRTAFVQEISEKDFSLSRSCSEGLDLYAVCRKD